MLLQIALDVKSIDAAVDMATQVQDSVDILEAGTSFIKICGLDAVRTLKAKFPGKLVLADMKTMDGGYSETNQAFLAGADISVVLGVAFDSTIEGAVKAAREHGKKLMVDLIGVPIEQAVQRAQQAEAMGADYVCVHTAHDNIGTGANSLDDLVAIQSVLSKAQPCVTGGITLDTIERMAQQKPGVLIIGSGITKAEQPAQVAAKIRSVIDQYKG